jgi:hypothetical protein
LFQLANDEVLKSNNIQKTNIDLIIRCNYPISNSPITGKNHFVDPTRKKIKNRFSNEAVFLWPGKNLLKAASPLTFLWTGLSNFQCMSAKFYSPGDI